MTAAAVAPVRISLAVASLYPDPPDVTANDPTPHLLIWVTAITAPDASWSSSGCGVTVIFGTVRYPLPGLATLTDSVGSMDTDPRGDAMLAVTGFL